MQKWGEQSEFQQIYSKRPEYTGERQSCSDSIHDMQHVIIANTLQSKITDETKATLNT